MSLGVVENYFSWVIGLCSSLKTEVSELLLLYKTSVIEHFVVFKYKFIGDVDKVNCADRVLELERTLIKSLF